MKKENIKFIIMSVIVVCIVIAGILVPGIVLEADIKGAHGSRHIVCWRVLCLAVGFMENQFAGNACHHRNFHFDDSCKRFLNSIDEELGNKDRELISRCTDGIRRKDNIPWSTVLYDFA